MQPVRMAGTLTWLPGCQITSLSEIEGLVSSTETCIMTMYVCFGYEACAYILQRDMLFALRCPAFNVVCTTSTHLGYLV